jgi:hypothetical protein
MTARGAESRRGRLKSFREISEIGREAGSFLKKPF